jgi:hypothetical protein
MIFKTPPAKYFAGGVLNIMHTASIQRGRIKKTCEIKKYRRWILQGSF